MPNELEAEIAELAARARRGNGGDLQRQLTPAEGNQNYVPSDPPIFARQTPEARAVRTAYDTAANAGIAAAQANLARAQKGLELSHENAKLLRVAGEQLAAQLDWPQPKS